MLTGGQVAGIIAAVFWAILVLFLAFVLVKLGQVLGEARKLVAGIADQTVPLLGEVTTSVTQVNVELQRVDAITANVQSMTGNISALASLFAATLGGPVVKVAAFSYGVRRAAGNRSRADLEKRMKATAKADKTAARASRRAGRGA
ncbi:MAG: DUF948 domain-containing protein [Actinomycetota bacterium]|nr:DUF948 domain-containing protein [Actinomycetota bacterium]